MQLEPNQKVHTIKKVDFFKGLLYFALTLVLVVIAINWDTVWTELQNSWMEVIKGIIIGLCSLPIMLFVATKIQDSSFEKEKNLEIQISTKNTQQSTSKSIFLLISLVLGILYSGYILVHFFGDYNQESIGQTMAIALVFPHILMAIAATIINIVAYIKNIKGWILFSAILYSISAILFLLYSPFLIPSIILCFVAWYKAK